MYITGSLINSYFICPRKTWLFAHELVPDPHFELLEIGRIIGQESYQRERKEIEMEGMKIDLLKRKEGELVVCEIKKSSICLESAKMQLVYYLYRLKSQGLNLKGEILIPREKKKFSVELTPELVEKLQRTIKDIKHIIALETPPPPLKTKFCRRCAFRDFCWV